MSVIRHSQKTNFCPRPQSRKVGSGRGREMFPWKRKYPWLVIAAEQLFVVASGSGDGMLEERNWAATWALTPQWLGRQLEALFPGINEWLDSAWEGKTDWRYNLKNRVYKMYYNGTSARGADHDPQTRASMSNEHWRTWSCRGEWETKILRIVSRQLVCRTWRTWL